MTPPGATPPEITAAPKTAVRRPVRLVALDVDGTTIDLDQRIHPRTRAAVRAAVAGGLPVVLATGRMYRSVLPWALDLEVRLPLVCYQGALVRTLPGEGAQVVDGVPQGETLAEDPVDPTVAVRALEVARAGGWHVQAYRGDRLLCDRLRPEGEAYSRIAQVEQVLVADLRPIMEAGSTKVVCVVEDEAGAAACETELRSALGAGARVVRSLPQFIEVTSPLASKARGVRRVCELLGIEMTEVAAVGDAPNDIDLLEAAGFAVAVRGAAPEVLRVADAVCGPPQQAGVADVLDRFSGWGFTGPTPAA